MRGGKLVFEEVLSHIHPIIVHFPIVIIILAVFYDLYLIFIKRTFSAKKGYVLWVIAFVAAWIAVGTGPEEDARGNTNVFHLHENLAHLTTIVAFLVTALRSFFIWKKKEMTKRWLAVYLVLSIAAAGGILGVGYYGGKMVYDQGVGVKIHGKYVNPPKKLPHD